MPPNRILLGIACLIVAFAIVTVVIYKNSDKSDARLVFSPTQVLGALWGEYKEEYVEEGSFRTIDRQRDNITTSEGQSYTMLRAVWQSDRETFDGAWKWTKDTLGHENDNLFGWLYGKSSSGDYRVLTEQGGGNSASDGDSDIALALIFAYARWQDPAYLESAQGILDDLWEKEVITIKGVPYLAANDIEKISSGPTAIVNPSYLSPASYHVFAKVDPDHDWNALADASYDVIDASLDSMLDATSSAKLPPNWVQIDKVTGEMRAINNPTLTTNYGYDAFRTPWRLALDYQWFGTPRAKEVLDKMSFLSETWERDGKLSAEYTHAGVPVTKDEGTAMYAGSIGYFIVSDPALAQEIYEKKLIYLFDPAENGWATPLSYYDSNWAWFGIALYTKQLPNLIADLPAELLQ